MKLKVTKKVFFLIAFLIFGASIMFATKNISVNKRSESNIIKKLSGEANVYQISVNDFLKCGGCKKSKAAKNSSGKKCGEGKCGAGKCGGAKSGSKKSGFMDKDTDGDGKVSFAEFSAYANKEFPNKDKNKDGKITSDECGMFDKFNTDGNDFISKEEFEAGHKMMFEKMDSNKDGFIEASELQGMHKCGEGKCGAGKCGKGMNKAQKTTKGKNCKH